MSSTARSWIIDHFIAKSRRLLCIRVDFRKRWHRAKRVALIFSNVTAIVSIFLAHMRSRSPSISWLGYSLARPYVTLDTAPTTWLTIANAADCCTPFPPSLSNLFLISARQRSAKCPRLVKIREAKGAADAAPAASGRLGCCSFANLCKEPPLRQPLGWRISRRQSFGMILINMYVYKYMTGLLYLSAAATTATDESAAWGEELDKGGDLGHCALRAKRPGGRRWWKALASASTRRLGRQGRSEIHEPQRWALNPLPTTKAINFPQKKKQTKR